MKICRVCLSSDILCSACHKKLENSEISQLDVDLSRAIFSVRPDASFSRYIETGNFVIILAEKDDARKIIGKAGRNVQNLSKKFNKQLKVVEIAPHPAMLEELLSVPIIAINKVYKQGESYKVRIDKRFSKKVRFTNSVAAKVISKPVEFVFE